MIFTQDDLPFVAEGRGEITIDSSQCVLNKTANYESDFFFTTKFGDGEVGDFIFGSSSTQNAPKLRIKAGTRANVIAIDAESTGYLQNVLSEYQLNSYLAENPDDILLLFELVPGKQSAEQHCLMVENSAAEIAFSPMGNIGYSYLRSFPRSAPFEKILKAHLAGVRLPAHLTSSPRSGEVIRYQYWGKLKLSTTSQPFEVQEEKSASISGGFLIEVREDQIAGWTRVLVCKRQADYQECLPALRQATTSVDWEQLIYDQAEEDEVLLDLSLNLTTEAGKALMRAVGQGDVSAVIGAENKPVVTVQHCIFSEIPALSLCA